MKVPVSAAPNDEGFVAIPRRNSSTPSVRVALADLGTFFQGAVLSVVVMKAYCVRALFFLATLLCGVALFACTGEPGSGTAAEDTRTVSEFDEVVVSGALQLELSLGKKPALKLSGDDNLLPLIETKVEGSKLTVSSKKNLDPKLPLRLELSAKNVKRVALSGAGKINVEGVDNDALAIELSGAGDVLLKGKTKKLKIGFSGAGKADATGLSASSVSVSISGAGKVELGEPKELDVKISGAGKVRYDGNPKISQKISGAGKLVKR